MGHMGTHAASVALYPNLAYKPDVDFEPIGMAAGTPILILAKKDFPPKDLKEFIAYVKANEAKLNMAHAGVGSVSHVTCLLLNSSARREADLDPVPRHRPGDECAGRRPGRLHDATRSSTRCRRCRAAPSRPMRSARRAQSGAAECADLEGSRPAGIPGLRLERAVRAEGHAEADPRQAHRALDKALDDEPTRKRLLELGSDIPGKDRRGQQALTRW